MHPDNDQTVKHGYNNLKSSTETDINEWVSTKAQLSQNRLDIDGHPVMQSWESPYMAELAKVAASEGGTVMEVGFGLGLSATAIQKHSVQEHIILEANMDVFKQLQQFKHHAQQKVTPVGPDLWQNTLESIPDNSLDGILYDTYPLVKEEQHIHQFDFIKRAYQKLRPGGILTYCNLTSLGVLRPKYSSWDQLFEETQLPHLLDCGFSPSDIKFETISVNPPANCEYYAVPTVLIPICRKQSTNGTIKNRKSSSKLTTEISPPSPGVCIRRETQAATSLQQGNNNIPSAELVSTSVARASKRANDLRRQLGEAESYLQSLEQVEKQRKSSKSSHLDFSSRRVNAWTQWGNLKEIVVGIADAGCFIPNQPGSKAVINQEGGSGATKGKNSGAGKIISEELDWPRGLKKKSVIDAANVQLDNLARVLQERGIRVLRPDPGMDWSRSLRTPFFDIPTQYCSTCPRDAIITLGNIVLEATMSRRDRYFESFACRDIVLGLQRTDRNMLWKAAPKPTMRDEMYNEAWWDIKLQERYERMYLYEFCVNESEPVFDAADITRCGKDVFIQLSMTTNRTGIDWVRRELAPHGFRVHMLRFPYDLAPSHLDCTFVPLRPGLVLTNVDRPCVEEDLKIFKDNGWRFIDAPPPNNGERPWGSQSSKWLSMNVLVIGLNVVVVEEQETSLVKLLEGEGFEVIRVPFRDVYEFGGGLHCATWDIDRDEDGEMDLFPVQESSQ